MPYFLARDKAVQQYEAAFHLLNVTFPLVKDPKLLMGVINNIFSSFELGMNAILMYERELRLIPTYLDNFQSKFNLFRHKSVRRNKIPQKHINLMAELKELLELHKKCPMEFQRGNRYVIASKNYQLKILSLTDLRDYVYQSKEFLDCVDKIIFSLNRK